MHLLAIAPLALSAAALVPLRPSVAPVDSRWQVIDRASEDGCDLTVTGDGRVYLVTVTGLRPNMSARYRVTNGDMKPVNWRVSSDSSGSFARYYMPFRWHRPGGTVTVSVTSEACAVSSSFDWRAARVMVH